MTRKDCEKKIADKMAEIWGIYRKYNPRGEYLSLYMLITDEGELKLCATNAPDDADRYSPLEMEIRLPPK